MASIKQIEANRLNSRKSTGPRTDAGKAAVAANPLKHGIFAQSPATAEEEILVLTIARNAWYLDRFAQLEVQIWGDDVNAVGRETQFPLSRAYQRNYARLTHLQHRVDSADRAYRRNLELLIKLQAARLKAVAPPVPEPEAVSQPQSPEPVTPEIGFVHANSTSGPPAARPNLVPGLDGQHRRPEGVKDSTQDADT